MKIPAETDAAVLSVMLLFVLLFNLIKIVMVPTLRNLKEAFASLFVGVPTGFLAGFVAHDQGASLSIVLVAASVCSLVARNIIMGIIEHGNNANEYLGQAIRNLIDRWTR